MKTKSRLLVLGATGKVGTLLRKIPGIGLGRETLWHSRVPRVQFAHWDLYTSIPVGMKFDAVLNLAGGKATSLEEELSLAKRANEVAMAAGNVPHFYASSQAVYPIENYPISEATPAMPSSEYGETKVAAEEIVHSYSNGFCLRLGNVAGADALFLAMKKGPVEIDQFQDGQGPRRSYIGPRALSKIVSDLSILACKGELRERVLNVAHIGTIGMKEIAQEAGVESTWAEAPASAIPKLELDVSRLSKLTDLSSVSAKELLSDAIKAGWVPRQ